MTLKSNSVIQEAVDILSPSHLIQFYLWVIPCPPCCHFPASLPPPSVFAVPSVPFWPPERPTQPGWIRSGAHKSNLNHRHTDDQCNPCLPMRLIRLWSSEAKFKVI